MQQRTAAFLMTDDVVPARIDVRVRSSESAPSRLKVCFTVDLNDHPYVIAGDGQEAPLPPEVAGLTVPLGNEFRLEMN